MGESAAPFGESDTRHPARKKTFELPTGSLSVLFTHLISSRSLKISVYSLGGGNHKVATDLRMPVSQVLYSANIIGLYNKNNKNQNPCTYPPENIVPFCHHPKHPPTIHSDPPRSS